MLHQVAAVYFGYAHARPFYYWLQLATWFAPPHSEAFQAVSTLNEEQQRLLERMFVQAAENHDNLRGHHRAYAALALNGHTEWNDD